jgi:hypothetical protein
MTGQSGPRLVPGDQLIGNAVEVIAHDLGLRTYSQHIHCLEV